VKFAATDVAIADALLATGYDEGPADAPLPLADPALYEVTDSVPDGTVVYSVSVVVLCEEVTPLSI
jgi:hypothetical protein